MIKMAEFISIIDLTVILTGLMHLSQLLIFLCLFWSLLAYYLYKKDSSFQNLSFIIHSILISIVTIVIGIFNVYFIPNIISIVEYETLPLLTILVAIPLMHGLLFGLFVLNFALFGFIYDIGD